MRILSLLLVTLAGCQLADDPDPPKCPDGAHIELGRCVKDEVAKTVIQIKPAAGGTLCTGDEAAQRPPTIEPASATVKVGEEFQFDNQDVVDHEIKGTDGMVWLSVTAGEHSAFTTLAKAGTFGYRVSGCAKGGTLVVE